MNVFRGFLFKMLRLFPLYPHSDRNFLRECPRWSWDCLLHNGNAYLLQEADDVHFLPQIGNLAIGQTKMAIPFTVTRRPVTGDAEFTTGVCMEVDGGRCV